MASALFITVRKTPVELPLVCHYYRTDGEEGLEKLTKQKRRRGGRRKQREGGPSEERKGKKDGEEVTKKKKDFLFLSASERFVNLISSTDFFVSLMTKYFDIALFITNILCSEHLTHLYPVKVNPCWQKQYFPECTDLYIHTRWLLTNSQLECDVGGYLGITLTCVLFCVTDCIKGFFQMPRAKSSGQRNVTLTKVSWALSMKCFLELVSTGWKMAEKQRIIKHYL